MKIVSYLTLMFALVLGATSLSAQFYTVSNWSLSNYPSLLNEPNRNDIQFTAADQLGPIINWTTARPLRLYGQVYDSFRIGSNGYLIAGTQGTISGATPDHSFQPGLVIAPRWSDLDPTLNISNDQFVAWMYDNPSGDLVFEWYDIGLALGGSGQQVNHPRVRMQVRVNAGSGAIQFIYGNPAHPPTNTTAGGAVAVSSAAGAGQEVIFGELMNGTTTVVDGSTGVMTGWYSNSVIYFDPATALQPAIEVREGSVTGTVVANGDTAPANTGRDFGSVEVNPFPVPLRNIVIMNSGGAAMTLHQPALTAGDTADFDFDFGAQSFPMNISAGFSFTFSVEFNPQTVGQKTATIAFGHNAPNTSSPFSFDVTGDAAPQGGATNPDLAVSENGTPIGYNSTANGTNRDFGSVDVGDSSAPITITIQNNGTGALSITSLNSSTADFVLDTGTFNGNIPAGGSSSFGITFEPQSPGSKTANIEFNHNDTGKINPFRFQVTGVGTAPATAIFQAREGSTTGPILGNNDPAGGARDFGAVLITNMPGGTVQIFILNPGSADLSLGTPDNISPDFQLDTSGFPSTLTPGSNASFGITFNAQTAGQKNASIVLEYNEGSGPVQFVINVTGLASTPGGPAPTGGAGGGGGGCVAAPGAGLWMLVALGGLAAVRRRRR